MNRCKNLCSVCKKLKKGDSKCRHCGRPAMKRDDLLPCGNCDLMVCALCRYVCSSCGDRVCPQGCCIARSDPGVELCRSCFSTKPEYLQCASCKLLFEDDDVRDRCQRCQLFVCDGELMLCACGREMCFKCVSKKTPASALVCEECFGG